MVKSRTAYAPSNPDLTASRLVNITLALIFFLTLFSNAYRPSLLLIWSALKGHHIFARPTFTKYVLPSLWRAAKSAALTALMAVTSVGIGRRLLRRLEIGGRDDRLMASIAFGLGLASLTAGIGIIGICHQLFSAILVGYLVILFLLSVANRQKRVELFAAWPVRAPKSLDEAAVAGLALFVLAHVTLGALAPISDCDVMLYHLTLPKLYLKAHRILPVPSLLHSHWPHFFELSYMLPLVFHLPSAAALLHALCVAVLALAVMSTSQSASTKSGPISLAIFLAWPVLAQYAGMAHADGALSLFSFLAAVSAWRGIETGRWSWYAVAGTLSGVSAACKLPTLGLHLFMFAWVAWMGRTKPQNLKYSLLFLITGLVVVAPWYLKTWAETGNPVWPFFSALFGGDSNGAMISAGILNRSAHSWSALLKNAAYSEWLLSLSLTTLGVLMWRKRMSPLVGFLLGPVLFQYIVVCRHNDTTRFMWPVLGHYSVVQGVLISSVLTDGWFGVAAAVALLFLKLTPLAEIEGREYMLGALNLIPPFASNRPPEEYYLARNDIDTTSQDKLNQMLKPSDKVLILGYGGGFYADYSYVVGDPFMQDVIDYDRIRDVQDLRSVLAREGITHIAFKRDIVCKSGRFAEGAQHLILSLIKNNCELVAPLGDGALYLIGKGGYPAS